MSPKMTNNSVRSSVIASGQPIDASLIHVVIIKVYFIKKIADNHYNTILKKKKINKTKNK